MRRAFTYTLTTEERARLDALARKRNTFWHERGTPTKRISKRHDDLLINKRGAYGEYAACQLYGIPFNWRWDMPDGHIDGTLFGSTVQIKTTPMGNRWLLFSKDDHFKAELAILVFVADGGNLVTTRIGGWVWREQFLAQRQMRVIVQHFGKQPAMDARQLRAPEELLPEFAF